MSNAELVQQAKAGKLVRVARGVYRMPVWPSQPQAPFAIAVKAAASGPSSTESPSSPYSSWHPRTIQDVGRHAEPRPAGPRERRQDRQIRCRATWIDGVPCQPLAAAIACAAQTMGADRHSRLLPRRCAWDI